MSLHFLKRIFVPTRTVDRSGPSTPVSGPVTDQAAVSRATDSLARTGPGFFTGASRFRLVNPTFTEVHGDYTVHVEYLVNQPLSKAAVAQSLESSAAVLLILNKKRVAGAEFDATDRNPPQCHPQTREELRSSLNTWLIDPTQRSVDFIWLWGSAGVGKSAVAQSFAEHCHAIQMLGAAFFFSGPAKRDSPDGIITTIAYQLAIHDAGYKHLITAILAEDPSIVDKKLDVQFQKLIVQPSLTLAAEAETSSTTQQQLAIIIDGLDECNSVEVQCELIKLIGGYVQLAKGKKFPFPWLVCSRPEWHLKRTFAQVDPPIECSREELTCNAQKDIVDVYIILKDGLQKIHDETSYSLTPAKTQWPQEIILQRLSHKVGGLPVLASTILRFITDAWQRKRLSPDSQLDACLRALENVTDEKVRPLDILDTFYRQIVSRVPSSVLQNTKRILVFQPLLQSRSWNPELAATAFDIARFLCLDEFTFYAALQDLHSVLDIPPPEKAREQPLKVFHKSFMDFLENPSRSGRYALDMDHVAFDVAVLGIRWYNYFLCSNCSITMKENICGHNTPDPTSIFWPSCASGEQKSLTRIQEFVEENGWDMWCIGDNRRKDILSELQQLDFCHLPYQFSMAEDKAFSRFVTWLFKAQHALGNTLVRVKPTTQTDNALLVGYQKSLPLEEGSFEDLTSEYLPYFFFSSHHSPEWPILGVMKVFWIGHGERAVLALMLDKGRFTPPESYTTRQPDAALRR